MKRWMIFLTFLVFVQGADCLQISPEVIELKGRPGMRVESTVQFTNESGEKILLSIDVPEWLKVSSDGLTLEPGEEKSVTLFSDVPSKKGELAGILTVRSRTFQDDWIEMRSHHPVYLKIAGTEVTKAKITRVYAEERDGGVWVEASFKNTGNVHIQPKFVAEVFGKKGEPSTEVVEARIHRVMPDEEVSFSFLLPQKNKALRLSKGKLSAFYHNNEGDVKRIQKSFRVRARDKK